MQKNVVLLTIPGLRDKDLEQMPNLKSLVAGGQKSTLENSFPAVTWPAQANMLTGKLPNEHGVTANGFFWREDNKVEMWTAWNEKIQEPQIWDLLHQKDDSITSAAWFSDVKQGLRCRLRLHAGTNTPAGWLGRSVVLHETAGILRGFIGGIWTLSAETLLGDQLRILSRRSGFWNQPVRVLNGFIRTFFIFTYHILITPLRKWDLTPIWRLPH